MWTPPTSHRPGRASLRLALAALALLTGCGRPAGEPPATPAPATPTPAGVWQIPAELEGTRWKLVELNSRPPLAGAEITLAFKDGRASGKAGCNFYQGPYPDVSPDEVIFQITVKECLEPPGVMEQEKAFVQALSSAVRQEWVDGRLEFRDAADALTLVFEPASPA